MLPCQKDLFQLDQGIHYINGAYMSPLMRAVEAAGINGMAQKRSPQRVSPQDFFTDTETLRGLFAQLVHAPTAQSVAIIPSVSYGTSIVAKNLTVQKGQKIVIAEAQFPSNVYPWMTLAQEKGLEIVTVKMPTDPKDRAKHWNKNILDSIDAQTIMVAIGHIHWANGTMFDLKQIGERIHAQGGYLVVDGTQSVGALPIDVQDFQIDALICGGYKWLMGPYSLGYAYLGERFQNGSPLEENWINRYNSEDFTRLIDYQSEYQPEALRFDVGERSNFILVPMGIAALEQLLDWSPARIQAYCAALTEPFVSIWREHGYWIEETGFRAAHLMGIQIPADVNMEALQQAMKEHHISVSVRGDFIRISPNVYNNVEDMEVLTKVLIGR